MPQNAESCAAGCLQYLPVVSGIQEDFDRLLSGVVPLIFCFWFFFFGNVSFDDVLSLMLNFLQLLPLPDVCCNNLLSVLTYLSLLIS